jgi:hypothetical protein
MECPRCGARKSWSLADGRQRCANCRLDWRPGRLPLRLSKSEWRTLLYWFVRTATSAQIAQESGLERKRVLRALAVVRQAMREDNPSLETLADDAARASGPASRRPRHAMLGLFIAHGLVGVDVTTEEELTRTRRGYAALVQRGRLQRVQNHGQTRAPFGQIEAFWSYLQRNLRAKGGIRPARLELHLAEFAWRYNHRKLSNPELAGELLRMISTGGRWNERDYPRAENNPSTRGFATRTRH